MEWKQVSELPVVSNTYVVHIRINEGTSRIALAFFKTEDGKWYKFDPFVLYYTPLEDISPSVEGWISKLPSFPFQGV